MEVYREWEVGGTRQAFDRDDEILVLFIPYD